MPTETNTATEYATISAIKEMFEATSTYRSIQAAIDADWTICKSECPIDDGREGLNIEEAMEIIASDPSVLYFIR